MHTNRVFNGLRLIERAKQSLLHPEGGVLPENLGGGVRPASQNPYPIYDQTKLCDIDPYPIYDLTKNSMPYL